MPSFPRIAPCALEMQLDPSPYGFHQPEKPESRLISKQGNAVEAAAVQVDPVRVLCSLLGAPLHPGDEEEGDGGVGDEEEGVGVGVGDEDEDDDTAAADD